VYDSLCPFPIPTDTVDCDCDLITGYGEPVPVAERFRVEIYPNPATEKMQIRLNDLTGQENRELKKVILFDLFGRIMLEKDFMKETNVGTESLNAGIYLVVVEQSGEVLARGKLVVL
jgi:signal recognition particle GTPase